MNREIIHPSKQLEYLQETVITLIHLIRSKIGITAEEYAEAQKKTQELVNSKKKDQNKLSIDPEVDKQMRKIMETLALVRGK